MEEPQTHRRGGAVLIKKGQHIPENAIPMSEDQVLKMQEKRIKNFKPQKEMRTLNYGTHVLSAFVALSGVTMNNTIRQNYRLGGLRPMFTFVPAVVLSALFAAGLHEVGIKRQILLGKASCPICMSLRSGTFQTFMGLGYTYFVSIMTCLPIAREFYTLPMPASENKVAGYLRLLRKVTPQSKILLYIGVSNMLGGMWIAKKEQEAFNNHLSKPPSYFQDDDSV